MVEHPALHGPARPSWVCLTCAEAWPCPTRKRQLKELCRCDVRLLRNYLTPYLRDARTEIVDLSLDEVTERFIGWCDKPLARWATQNESEGDAGASVWIYRPPRGSESTHTRRDWARQRQGGWHWSVDRR